MKTKDPKTIFLRYSPPLPNLNRHHIEHLCGTLVGPVKKCSLIRKQPQPPPHEEPSDTTTTTPTTSNNSNNTKTRRSLALAAGYAFVKFTTEEDAMEAVKQMGGGSTGTGTGNGTQPKQQRKQPQRRTFYMDNETNELLLDKMDTDVDMKSQRYTAVSFRAEKMVTPTSTTPQPPPKQEQQQQQQQETDNDNDNDKDAPKGKPKSKPQPNQQVDVDETTTTTKPSNHSSLKPKENTPATGPGPESSPHNRNKNSDKNTDGNGDGNGNGNDEGELLQKRKRSSRLILRNLSFYASAKDVKKAMERDFGPVLEVEVPSVPGTDAKQKSKQQQHQHHRGFAFVTFRHPQDATRAVQQGTATIKKREVAMDYSLHKLEYRKLQKQQKEKQTMQTMNEKEMDVDVDENVKGDESNASYDQSDEDDDDGDSGDDSGDDSDSSEDTDTSSSSHSTKSKDDADSDDHSDASDNDDEEVVEKELVDRPKKKDRHRDREQGENIESENGSGSNAQPNDHAIAENRKLFLRNLPFDCTRHDLFTLLAPFGKVSSIYLVKDKETKMPKGTAFVEYEHPHSARKALAAAEAGPTAVTKTATETDGLMVRGRRLVATVAVDRVTATTLESQLRTARQKIGKDRRHLYLRHEGRVEESTDDNKNNAWEDLPESDRQKRGRAHNEKALKLRSPLFFVNPRRLSLRNLSKSLDETQLRPLLVESLQRGLERQVVTTEDLILQQRASGEFYAKQQQQQQPQGTNNLTIPDFDPKQLKESIPSVYVDRDPNTQVSRGFAFVEFTHHAHALACLRELNNNPRYSRDYVAGGKGRPTKKRKKHKSDDNNNNDNDKENDNDAHKVPRLIVEFTVENKAKANEQAERRERQLAHAREQKEQKKQKRQQEKRQQQGQAQPKKPSRGRKQRERKRRRKEEQEVGTTVGTDDAHIITGSIPSPTQAQAHAQPLPPPSSSVPLPKGKPIKPPPKRKKVDPEELKFEQMVRSYKASLFGNPHNEHTTPKMTEDHHSAKDTSTRETATTTTTQTTTNPREKVTTQRWFD